MLNKNEIVGKTRRMNDCTWCLLNSRNITSFYIMWHHHHEPTSKWMQGGRFKLLVSSSNNRTLTTTAVATAAATEKENHAMKRLKNWNYLALFGAHTYVYYTHQFICHGKYLLVFLCILFDYRQSHKHMRCCCCRSFWPFVSERRLKCVCWTIDFIMKHFFRIHRREKTKRRKIIEKEV